MSTRVHACDRPDKKDALLVEFAEDVIVDCGTGRK